MNFDTGISYNLALAIGWEDDQIAIHQDRIYVADWPSRSTRRLLRNRMAYPVPLQPWRLFDYRDPAVIWPIAERYDAFPTRLHNTNLWRSIVGTVVGIEATRRTPAHAVAEAVTRLHLRQKPLSR